MTVLVCDDAMFMRNMIKRALAKTNYKVIGEAANGLEAVEKYVALNPDVVTLDITMPQMDGIEALKKIKEINPNAKVIIVSAMGQEIYVREAIIAGANAFIIKPFKNDSLIEAFDGFNGR